MLTEFDPVKLSILENQFVIENVGKAPVVGLQNRPEQVTLAAVKPIIEGAYEHIEMAKADPTHKWAGIEAIKSAAQNYIVQANKWEKAAKDPRTGRLRPGAVRFPSMYGWDARNRPHWRAVGSDSDQVRTYFDANGDRLPFKIALMNQEAAWAPEWAARVPKIAQWTLVVNAELSRIECPCGATETFKPESRASYNAARARMSKHLRRVTDQVEEHRELHTNEFGS